MTQGRHGNYHYREVQMRRPRRHWLFKATLFLAIVGVVGFGIAAGWKHLNANKPSTAQTSNVASTQTASTSSTAATTTSPSPNECANNSTGKLLLVSISRRHMWACDGTTKAYDSAVITGMENLPADLTPTGTYKITSKTTNTHLIGSDSTGHWDDFVNYWMPFLHNQYGTYGFHDATWRDPSAFGNISPYSSDASHGCVETPLTTAKWIYDWAAVGTTVTVES